MITMQSCHDGHVDTSNPLSMMMSIIYSNFLKNVQRPSLPLPLFLPPNSSITYHPFDDDDCYEFVKEAFVETADGERELHNDYATAISRRDGL